MVKKWSKKGLKRMLFGSSCVRKRVFSAGPTGRIGVQHKKACLKHVKNPFNGALVGKKCFWGVQRRCFGETLILALMGHWLAKSGPKTRQKGCKTGQKWSKKVLFLSMCTKSAKKGSKTSFYASVYSVRGINSFSHTKVGCGCHATKGGCLTKSDIFIGFSSREFQLFTLIFRPSNQNSQIEERFTGQTFQQPKRGVLECQKCVTN